MQGYPHDVIVMAERQVNRQDRPEGESVLLYDYVKKYYSLINIFWGGGRGELRVLALTYIWPLDGGSGH